MLLWMENFYPSAILVKVDAEDKCIESRVLAR
jgi:hypothetical protein